jgi:protein KRI1
VQVDYARLAAAFADELDKEWDGDAYDRKMAALFGEEFYGAGEEEVLAGADGGHGAGGAGGAAWSLDEEVPEAESDAGDAEEEEGEEEDEEEEAGAGKGKGKAGAKEKGPKLPAWVFGDGPRPSWAGPSAEELARGVDGFEGVFKGRKTPGARDTMAMDGGEGGEEEDEEEEEEEDPAVVGLGGGRRNRHKRKRKTGKALTAVGRAKAALEAEAAAAGAGGVAMDDPDEVLALGFEDVIAGGVKTRMRYREVPAQDFGLEADEILLLDDGDLNKYVGLKRLAPYREAEWQVPPNMRKRVLRELRSKLKRELKEGGPAAGGAAGAGAGAGASKKKPSGETAAAAEGEEEGASADAPAAAGAGEEVKSRKQLKKERRKAAAAAAAAAEAAPVTASATSAAADSDSDAEGAEDGAAAGDKKKKRRRNRKGKGGGGEGAAGDAAAGASSGAGAAPAIDAPLSGHKRSRPSGGKKGDAKAEKDAVVTLPTGAAIKKSRLASYGL